MATTVALEAVYLPSDDVVAREIEGEIIIVPLTSDVGNVEDALFTLNETGRAIWEQLDGQRSLRDVAAELSAEYDAPAQEIEADVLGLVEELVKRSMLAEVSGA